MILALVVMLSSVVHGAIPRSTPTVVHILSKKGADKVALLKKQGPQVYADLKQITFDSNRSLGLRWQAFMAMVRIGEKESLPEVITASKSPDWFLRDASIKVLPLLDEAQAREISVKALDDSALVVRTTAVLALRKMKVSSARDRLWKELYSKENYMRSQSLWIRRYIVETLSEMAVKGEEEKFVKVLDDDDSTLFPSAIAALEKITGQKLGDPGLHPVYKRHLWRKWFEESKEQSSST